MDYCYGLTIKKKNWPLIKKLNSSLFRGWAQEMPIAYIFNSLGMLTDDYTQIEMFYNFFWSALALG